MKNIEKNGTRWILWFFCESCSLYIGTTEAPTLLARLAFKYGKEVGEVK